MTSASSTSVFRVDRMHIISAAVMAMILLLLIGAKPLYLFWLEIFPALFAYWALKSHTTLDATGIHATDAFRGRTDVPWDMCEGIRFGSRAFVRTTEGKDVALPGVSFNSLPRLAAASGGRIPDALSQGRAAADEKVVVIHRDGRQVLLTREEAQEHIAHNQDLVGKAEQTTHTTNPADPGNN